MQIDQTRYNIDVVDKEINLLKQSWLQKQNRNALLLDQHNKQLIELNKMHKCKYVYCTLYSI